MESRSSTPAATPPRAQFIHVEHYATVAPHGKQGGRCIGSVAKEAEREPGHCPHVVHPVAPILHFGVRPLAAAALSRAWAQEQVRPYFHKASGTTKSRRQRSDQACALAGVISCPPEVRPGPSWQAFVEKCIGWLMRKYGNRLKSVVEHTDEPQLHLHFFVVPRHGERFSAVHQGLRAIEELPPLPRRTLRMAAFSRAMSEYQDEFFTVVGEGFGLARTSVGGRRLKPAQFDRHKVRRTSGTHSANPVEEAGAAAELVLLREQLSRMQRRNAELEEMLAQGAVDAMYAAIGRNHTQAAAVSQGRPAAKPGEFFAAQAVVQPPTKSAVRPADDGTPGHSQRQGRVPRL